MFCVFLYGPFCHGALKLDLSTFYNIFSLNISSIYVVIKFRLYGIKIVDVFFHIYFKFR